MRKIIITVTVITLILSIVSTGVLVFIETGNPTVVEPTITISAE